MESYIPLGITCQEKNSQSRAHAEKDNLNEGETQNNVTPELVKETRNFQPGEKEKTLMGNKIDHGK